MMQPNFIGIGAQKCASSWMYDILSDHPEVLVSNKKELDFFSYQYERGYGWYEAQFSSKEGVKAVGEISPSYFNECSVPERVRKYRPDIRILLSLRDPIERALSQHRHLVRIGYIQGPDYSFDTALRSNPSYIEQGLYAKHLQRWWNCFGRENVFVLLMDDIRADATKAARDVYRFLGVSDKFESIYLNAKSNESYAIRNRAMDKVICTMRGTVGRAGIGTVWKLAGDLGLRKFYRGLNRVPSSAVIPPATKQTLTDLRLTFTTEICELENMLGRPLDGWLK